MSNQRILLLFSNPEFASSLERGVLKPAGYQVAWIDTLHAAESVLGEFEPDLIVMGDRFVDGNYSQLADKWDDQYPDIPRILMPSESQKDWPLEALRKGFEDCLMPPLQSEDVLAAVERGLTRRERWRKWSQGESRRQTSSLRRKVDELETLALVGRSVTAELDLDQVLAKIVDAAVDLTGAEEGNLLLLDAASGELYMRAARNFQDEFVRTFRLPVSDTMAGQVIQSGTPLLIDESTPQKIKTAYLVRTLIYVPLKVHGSVIGVLGVDNRTGEGTFQEHHITLMSAIADYAAIAIENARLYSGTEVERRKLEAILTQIDDGVIVTDPTDHILLFNHAAQKAFNLEGKNLAGKSLEELQKYPDLVNVFNQISEQSPFPVEVELADGRVFSAQATQIPEVGRAITLQNVTHFKELDRIKSDFVNTVSHDLRSPLTAILGYVELIARIGPVNHDQAEFIRRVQASVATIRDLINKLLDLGRIEAGFDKQMEDVSIPALINLSAEGLHLSLEQKQQKLHLEYAEDLRLVRGNPIRLQQMFTNLIDNAIKYTPPKGEITVRAQVEGGQMIVQVCDTGMGIPPADQPYIFDKMYRASNVPDKSPGSGLGLSIVKSIVESHQGRIWAESKTGEGSIFTLVFPFIEAE
jgi:two-component system NtrC family sensor kinase